MTSICDEIWAELSPLGRDLLAYWLELRKDALMPDRSEFNPMEIKPLLPNIVIHELISPERIRLRLVGTAVVQQYGRESTGMNYLDFVEPARRERASKAIFLVREHPAAMTVSLRASAETGLETLRRTIALPVADRKDGRQLVYYCSTLEKTDDPLTTEPDKMAVQSVTHRRFFDIGAGVPDFSE